MKASDGLDAAGGSLTIDIAPGMGTTITGRLPLTAATPATPELVA